MELSSVAELQVLLEGVPLPNERSSLLQYALHEGASGEQLALLQRLPDRRYDNIDEVAEDVGLRTAATLRLHFRRALRTTPTAYRRRFSKVSA